MKTGNLDQFRNVFSMHIFYWIFAIFIQRPNPMGHPKNILVQCHQVVPEPDCVNTERLDSGRVNIGVNTLELVLEWMWMVSIFHAAIRRRKSDSDHQSTTYARRFWRKSFSRARDSAVLAYDLRHNSIADRVSRLLFDRFHGNRGRSKFGDYFQSTTFVSL